MKITLGGSVLGLAIGAAFAAGAIPKIPLIEVKP